MAVNIFAHRLDIHNPGDYWSSPGRWLGDRLPGDIFDYKQLADLRDHHADRLIIGGGGFGAKFIACIDRFLSQNRVQEIVIWGTAWESGRADLQEFLAKCSLAGVREWRDYRSDSVTWVPCASVLHSRLPRMAKHQPQADWLVVDHWKRKAIQFGLQHTRMTNYNNSMDQILEAIAGHRFVLTSSYHVVYWSLLLKRRVAFVSNPWLPKIDHMRWPVPAAETFAWRLIDETQIYPDAYDQALQANLDFLAKVQSL